MRVTRLRAAGAADLAIAAAVSVSSQQPKIGYDDTPMQPNGKWHVHDGARPQPKMVTPGATPGAAPADATVLLGTRLRRQRLEDVHRRRRRDVADERRRSAVQQGNDRDQGAVHRLPAAHRVRHAEGSQGRRSGPRQQRRLPARRVRSAGPRQLQQPDLSRRSGRQRCTGSIRRW